MSRRQRSRFTFDVDRALELTGTGARVMLVLFIVTQVALAVASGGEPMRSWRGFVALAVVIASAVVVVAPGPYPMRTSWVLGIVVAVGVSTALMNWSLDPHVWPGYTSWHFGANTFVLLAVALRGRAWWAWAGMVVMVALTVSWTVTTGQGVLQAVDLIDRHVGTLLIGTLFAVGLSSTMRSLQRVTESQNARAAGDDAARAALRVRDQRLDWLERTAAPALRRIADGSPLGAGERAELLITEGMLRDTIRGGILAREPMVSSTGNARRRGVDVVLLDDSGHGRAVLSDGDEATALAWVADQLDAVDAGSFTARVSVSESTVIVSVVGDVFGQRTREFARVARWASPSQLSSPSPFSAIVARDARV